MVRWAARSRRSLRARIPQSRRARSATAPAAIATIPAVLVRLCTGDRIRSPRTAPAPGSAYWKSTGKVSELFDVVFSPGTGTTVAVNCWEPLGGIPFSVTVHWVDSPAVVWGTLVWPLIFEPATVTL